jgi:protein TonB
MEQPAHDLRPFQHTARQDAPSRAVSVGLVVAIHLLAIYGLATGLAQNLYRKAAQELKAEVIPPKQAEVKPPPPPPPELQKPPPPFVPPPDIVIQSEAAPTNTITVQNKVASLPPPPPKPAAQAPVSAPALIEGGAGKCEASYYPAVAVRLNQTGTSTVAVHIGADGSVQSVSLVDSSGHDSLDQAAIRCIQGSWRYRPATMNGQPVATVKEYAIKWVLQ